MILGIDPRGVVLGHELRVDRLEPVHQAVHPAREFRVGRAEFLL